MTSLRKWLFAGLLVLVPIMITWALLDWAVTKLDTTLHVLPNQWHPDALLGMHIPGIGVVFALLVLLVVGALTSNMVGTHVLKWWNALLHRIPVVRPIYSSVKQISDTLFSEKGNAFREAVLIQWPQPGMWTIALVTGTPSGEVAAHVGPDHLSVFVPTTPNPTGGYFVVVAKADCKRLNMSVDAALTYVISMGVIAPKAGPVSPSKVPPSGLTVN